MERPAFADPGQPVPPLAALAPEPPAQRDPKVPFDVAASVMTAETSAWASANFPSAPAGPTVAAPSSYGSGAPSDSPAVNGQRATGETSNGRRPPETTTPWPAGGSTPGYPPPAGAPGYPPPTYSPIGYPPPTYPPPGYSPPGDPPSAPYPSGGPGGQPFPPPGPAATNGPFAAPGTPQWFAPGDYRQPPPPPPAPTARTVLAAATPGVLITLVIGGFIWVLAPVTVIVAFVLSGRITYGRKVTRTAFAAVLSFLGLVGLLSLITADGSFSQWWDTVARWACFGSWVMIVATVIAAYRALKQGRPDPPPARGAGIR